MTTYLTIKALSSGIYKDKGSKFLAFAEPVTTLEEVKQKLESYRKQYHDARHVCYAYMLGAERLDYRQSDDGEPSGTAGKPILGQINSKGLTNVLVVVVRYFGGILLGTGGLIVAYRESAKMALESAEITERQVLVRKQIRFTHEQMNEVMRLIKQSAATIVSQDYDNEYIYSLDIPVAYSQTLDNFRNNL